MKVFTSKTIQVMAIQNLKMGKKHTSGGSTR